MKKYEKKKKKGLINKKKRLKKERRTNKKEKDKKQGSNKKKQEESKNQVKKKEVRIVKKKKRESQYAAFDSPSYPHLASLGVDIEWNMRFLLRPEGAYRPRFKLNPNVIRIPIVPGCDPCKAYGDLISRGVKGVVLEAFGVGNMPDQESAGWLPWLRDQRSKGLQVYLASQCTNGPLQPELYHSGSVALALGVEAGPQMTPECAVVKMMLCMAYPDIPPGVPLAGEM
eukprot:TRINITY_DN13836_c0_g1_i1.p2 TRINITY_DN13836_c0_g1~~TRINITY_DN13836_c0_g1_i1.p2  ORF type:complete len:237 (+),score=46.65 TRINITY_DN13836_c0_g1_i1:33-713(+)